MGYLQALKLMVRAYKAAKGTMPKGLDLLKLKMRARQKAIDSKKVIEFPKDRITDPFKPRPQGIEKLIKKGDIKIGKAPKTTKVKEPVDPKLILQESEKQTLARMRKENKEAIKRFKEKMDKPRDGKAIGGYVKRNVTPRPNDPKLQNLLDVYESNPTLQSQMTADEYLMQTYRPSPSEPQTYAQMTQQQPAAGIPAVKPIRPIIPVGSESDDDGPPPGGGIREGINLDYGYTSPGGKFNLEDIREGTVADEDYTLGMRASDAYSGIVNSPLVKYNPMNPMFMFNVGKAGLEKAREFAEKVRAEKIEEQRRKEAVELRAALQRAQAEINRMGYQDYGSGGGLDPSLNDPVTGEYTGASKQDYGSGE
tara:strand:+ start:263 stop:1360 length:1098 start_codon:yes stop_codon:yes gene_type:complete